MRITKKELEDLRQINLLSYLTTYYPDELVKCGRTDFRTFTHSSLYLSNGKWYWWKRGIGGLSALDFLIKVEGYSFKDAVKHLLKLTKIKPVTFVKQKPSQYKEMYLKVDADSKDNMIRYLNGKRHIDKDIIEYCIENQIVFESEDHQYVVFVGYDEHIIPRFATKRSMYTSEKREVSGSTKSFSFNIPCCYSDILHVFESAIDLLSFITIQKIRNEPYLNENYLSLSGVSGDSYPALKSFLDKHRHIRMIYLHLDNDEAGRYTTNLIKNYYGRKYYIFDQTPQNHKDVNEELEDLINVKVYNRNYRNITKTNYC